MSGIMYKNRPYAGGGGGAGIFLDIPILKTGDIILPTNTEGQSTLAKLKTLAQKTKVD